MDVQSELPDRDSLIRQAAQHISWANTHTKTGLFQRPENAVCNYLAAVAKLMLAQQVPSGYRVGRS